VKAESDTGDQILLAQVAGSAGMLLLAFAESALGQIPLFFGNAPRILLIMVFILNFLRPGLLPLGVTVLVGMVYDLVQGNPLGYTSSVMIVVQAWVEWRRTRLANADAGIIWSEFCLIMMVVQIFGLVVVMFYTGHLPAIRPVVFQFAASVFLFPVLYWLSVLLGNISVVFQRLR